MSEQHGSLTVIRLTAADEAAGRQIILHYNDKDFSYVDASSFAVMNRLDIQTAFSFDRHFEQYGFRAIMG